MARGGIADKVAGLIPPPEIEISNEEDEALNMGLKEEVSKLEKMASAFGLAAESLKKLEAPKKTWLAGSDGFDECIVNFGQIPAGLGDGVIEELRSVPELIVLGGQVFTDEQFRNDLKKTLSNTPELINNILDTKEATYSDPKKMYHEGSKDLVALVTIIGGVGLVSAKQIVGHVGKKSDLAKKVADEFDSKKLIPKKGIILDKARVLMNDLAPALRSQIDNIAVTSEKVTYFVKEGTEEAVLTQITNKLKTVVAPQEIVKDGITFRRLPPSGDLIEVIPKIQKKGNPEIDILEPGKKVSPKKYEQVDPAPNPTPGLPLPPPPISFPPRDIDDEGCGICQESNLIVQEIYNDLCKKLGGDIVLNPNIGSLERLCEKVAPNDLLRDDKLESIGIKLNELDGPILSAKLNALMSDIRITVPGNPDHVANNLATFEAGWVDAWETLKTSANFEYLSISKDWLDRIDQWDIGGIYVSEENSTGDLLMSNKSNGDIFAYIIIENSNEVIYIENFAFLPLRPPTSGTVEWSKLVIPYVRSLDGGDLTGGRLARTSDGTIGFIQSLYLYGDDIIENAAKDRSNLRDHFPNILGTEQAHHLIPVALLDNNVVRAAVIHGFDFNGLINGMPLEKYNAATDTGRHARHDDYTRQIRIYIQTKWSIENPDWTPQMALEEIEDLTNTLRERIENSTGRINLLDLGL